MAVFKCKMCGGDLEVTEGMKVVECEYCGTTQTVPNSDNEKKMNLFNRANRLRIANEFDRAAGVYENIISEFPQEAEAYWGLCLCKFGIEYVDDPRTAEKIPTCHRTAFESIFDDSNFKTAIELSDPVAKKVYNSEARIIDTLQQNILTIVNRERPFDVFICYKETDSKGDRTMDSVLAQDIYDALTAKGLKVFFARITLEDKLGQEYEPYIFAALNSAKIMLAIGTAEEYYNAVWVKNEWSRFLSLMKNDRSKVLIPCYKDIDAYDMPAEFRNLQAQDMGKLGFVQDLTRGVCKILGVEEKKETVVKETIIKEKIVSANESKVNSLLERAFMFLEDEEWESADEYCEKILDLEPQNAMAYLYKLCAELKISSIEKLSDYNDNFENRENFKKAVRFADNELKNKIYEIIAKQNERIGKEEKEYGIKKTAMLDEARSLLEKAENISDFKIIKKMTEDKELTHDDDVIDFVDELGAKIFEKAKKSLKTAKKTSDYIYISDMTEIYKDCLEFCACGELVDFDKEENLDDFLAEVREKKQPLLDESFRLFPKNVDVQFGHRFAIGLKQDGTVVATGENDYGQCNVEKWKNIVAISVGYGYTIGVKADGTVVAVGDNEDGACNVENWKNIVAVSAGGSYTVGLKSDGTVVATGSNKFGQCNVENWESIVAVSAGDKHTVGLKSDGTVVATGFNEYGQCNIEDWNNIEKIYAKEYCTVGIKKDGTVVAKGKTYYVYSGYWEEFLNRKNVVSVSIGKYHIAGLRSDGSAFANIVVDSSVERRDSDNKCSVYSNGWEKLIAVKVIDNYTFGLKPDGTVVITDRGYRYDDYPDAEKWENIVAVYSGDSSFTGVKTDGTVVSVGDIDLTGWKLFNGIDELLEKEKAEKEAARKAKIESLEKEKATLEAELPNIKGLFSGSKKAKVEARIAEIEKELQTLK